MDAITYESLVDDKTTQKAKSYYQELIELRNSEYVPGKIFNLSQEEKLKKFKIRQLEREEKLNKIKMQLMQESATFKLAYILYVFERHSQLETTYGKTYPFYSLEILPSLFGKDLPVTENHLLFMLDRVNQTLHATRWRFFQEHVVELVVEYLKDHPASQALYEQLGRLYGALFLIQYSDEYKKLRRKVRSLIQGRFIVPLFQGEAWSDQAICDITNQEPELQKVWTDLLQHCEDASGGKPNTKWAKAAKEYFEIIGGSEFLETVQRWFPLIDKPATVTIEEWPDWRPDPNQMINPHNANIIKGLVWCCGFLEGKPIARTLRDLAVSAYKKVPGIGPRAVKIGNACIYSLGTMEGMDGLYQLAYLKVKVRFKTALKLIDKMLTETAERLDIPREDLEEMSVPGYGLTDVGLLEEQLGDFTARIQIHSDNKVELKWIKPDGKPQKSVPASVKNDHADELKELKATIKDIQKMIPAQKERIQSVYLQQKVWPYSTWKERYLDHPLVGTLVRRLLWTFEKDGTRVDGVYANGQIIDVDGNDLSLILDDNCQVELWHPITHNVDYIKKWRNKLVALEIKQPFKQVHREVYLLTEAEKETGIYSNRYAAHIVKQHQFNSLCSARGWYNTLKLMVDDDFPPASILLPKWNLRAEFWTDGVGEEYGEDTNDNGTFYYLATDQVRFFPVDSPQTYAHAFDRGQGATADPVSLEDIPPLVFSEVMRDVDLFVGVSSVGNDPQWADAGPEGHQTYWHRYSFGDLSQQAQTRKDVLMDLVPRLAIAEQCTFDGKFLKVQGSIRGYKIHLGSGNILMEPNDSYLCIVRNQSKEMKDGTSKLFLPFEGDEMLSVIISKALLLANDDKIKDSTIVSQIKKF